MRKISIFTMLVFLAVFGFISCSEDKKTELGWTNKSGEAINDIIWADGDGTWNNGDAGYAIDANTEQKEVSKLEGDVDCLILDSGEFTEAQVLADGQSSLVLSEGESYRYDIVAVAISRKK